MGRCVSPAVGNYQIVYTKPKTQRPKTSERSHKSGALKGLGKPFPKLDARDTLASRLMMEKLQFLYEL